MKITKKSVFNPIEYTLTPESQVEQEALEVFLKNLAPEKSVVMNTGSQFFEVYHKDLGVFDWGTAIKVCKELGDGWRIPTKDELNVMRMCRSRIKGLAESNFWSSTEYSTTNAWAQHFYSGYPGDQYYYIKTYALYVRPVRTI